jgi:hypothetical protein
MLPVYPPCSTHIYTINGSAYKAPPIINMIKNKNEIIVRRPKNMTCSIARPIQNNEIAIMMKWPKVVFNRSS